MRRFRGICSVDGCEKNVSAVQLCSMHYQRLKRTGDVGPVGLLDRSGANNANWRGGRRRGGHEGRYWMVYTPDHPDAVLGAVLEHRLVMEQHLGRQLTTDEVVHHINHDTLDNRIENLEVMTQAEHCRVHFTKEPV